MKEIKTSVIVLLSFWVAALALYWPALFGGPLVDDFRLLETAKNGGWFDNFNAPAPDVPGVFWRPVVSVFFKLQWHLFHLNFGGYRMTSALLSALTALCIYGILHKLTRNRLLAIIAGALFIVWPSHAETMIWIAGQTDGLSTCLAAIALWIFVGQWSSDSIRWWKSILWLIPLILAMLGKETMIVMPMIIFVFAIILRPDVFRSRRFYLAALFVMAILLPIAYLMARGFMLHQPLLGGGYETKANRHLIQRLFDGLQTYHLNLNLLNAYAPLSSRPAEALRFSADIFPILLLTFGLASLVRFLPRRETIQRTHKVITLLIIATFIGVAFLQVFGSYPIVFVRTIIEFGAGLVAACTFAALVLVIAYRERKALRAKVGRFVTWSLKKPFVAVGATLLTAYVLLSQAKAASPHPMPLLFIASYWAVMFITRPKRSHDSEMSMVARVGILMFIASIMAIVPVLTIRQVDDNLANARLVYPATAFAVPAVAAITWSFLRRDKFRMPAFVALGALCCFAILPVIRVWAQSVKLSTLYCEAIKKSSATKVYVLVSPGFIPSATTVILGGDALDASGRLLRSDRLLVIPGYYADGFTLGDTIHAEHIRDSTWRISTAGGTGRYRSGFLTLLPCYPDFQMSPAYVTEQELTSPRQMDVTVTDPEGDVIAVDENGVIHLRKVNREEREAR